MGCQIYIGTFFFRFYHSNVLRFLSRRVGQGHAHWVRKIMAQNNFDIWQRLQSAQINLLPHWFGTIRRSGFHKGCEIFDLMDCVFGKHELAKFCQIKPSIGRFSQSPIIQIKGIDVDVSFQSHKKQKPPFGGLAPCAEATGVVLTKACLKVD